MISNVDSLVDIVINAMFPIDDDGLLIMSDLVFENFDKLNNITDAILVKVFDNQNTTSVFSALNRFVLHSENQIKSWTPLYKTKFINIFKTILKIQDHEFWRTITDNYYEYKIICISDIIMLLGCFIKIEDSQFNEFYEIIDNKLYCLNNIPIGLERYLLLIIKFIHSNKVEYSDGSIMRNLYINYVINLAKINPLILNIDCVDENPIKDLNLIKILEENNHDLLIKYERYYSLERSKNTVIGYLLMHTLSKRQLNVLVDLYAKNHNINTVKNCGITLLVFMIIFNAPYKNIIKIINKCDINTKYHSRYTGNNKIYNLKQLIEIYYYRNSNNLIKYMKL